MADLTEYLDLVPSANRQAPRFIASLSAALAPLLAVSDVAGALPEAFDLDTAVGVQLDAVGVRVGLSRYLSTPIEGVYFAFDTAGVGFDEGVWLGPFDPVEGVTSLDDETYRMALKIKAAANNWDGSLEGAQGMLAALALDGTFLFAQDGFDMSMTFGVSGIVPNALFLALLQQAAEWVRPATVRLDLAVTTSETGAAIFGFDVQNSYVAGFDSGAWAVFY